MRLVRLCGIVPGCQQGRVVPDPSAPPCLIQAQVPSVFYWFVREFGVTA